MDHLSELIAQYKALGAPGDQNALISLLRQVQQENGGSIPRSALPPIADGCGVRESFLLAIIRRIPSLRLADRHTLELCAGPNCGKHAALARCAEEICKENPRITLKFVPCMRRCAKGPNLRWNGTLYSGATEELLRSLTDQAK